MILLMLASTRNYDDEVSTKRREGRGRKEKLRRRLTSAKLSGVVPLNTSVMNGIAPVEASLNLGKKIEANGPETDERSETPSKLRFHFSAYRSVNVKLRYSVRKSDD